MKNITEAIQLIGTHNIHSRFHELCIVLSTDFMYESQNIVNVLTREY